LKNNIWRFFLLSGVLLSANVQGQTSISSASVAEDYVQTSHWSMSFKTGLNYFRVAPPAYTHLGQIHLLVGGTLEYSINPLVGLGLEYMNNPFSRPYYALPENGDMKGGSDDFVTFASINFSNLLAPIRHNSWRNLDVFGNFGVGLGFYHYNLDNGRVSSANDKNLFPTPMATIGVNAEYTLNEYFALGLEGQYRLYDKPGLGGASTQSTDCDALTISVGLRYKFGTSRLPHARNLSLSEYYPKPTPVFSSGVRRERNVTPVSSTSEVSETSAEISGYNVSRGVTQTNAVVRNNAPVRVAGTLNQQLKQFETDLTDLPTKSQGKVTTLFRTVEFKFGSSYLTENSFATLDQIALLLIKNTVWGRLEIFGHTDNIGDVDFNQRLSEMRASRVKDYLIRKGVPSVKIVAAGFGGAKPISSNDSADGRQKNRRVEFVISK
jgi:outer membrane protein OmpA-like peptidoglycan-associated protein